MTSETITLIANIALAVSAIIALVFGIVQVKTATRDRQEKFTLEALRNFNTREFSELMNYVTAHEIPPTHEDWQKLPADERIIITQFAQEMESLGILVAERLINIELVDKTIGSLVSIAWDKYKVMIDDSRKKRPDPFLCEYFQWLAERIDEKMRIAPREPFYLK
ncbi:MAG TPA: hypothetical protein VG537_04810 [Candidatus Kapabacteria bacterium]|jgi:hypothetical protein|nr:hypothetical protein [Candidatus Kapabacteria bacterium]